MQVGVAKAADIKRIVAEIDDAAADDIVLVLVVAADDSAEDLAHKQAAVFARARQVGGCQCAALGSLLTPFAEHKDFGLREAFVGIGKLCLPICSQIDHFKGIGWLP